MANLMRNKIDLLTEQLNFYKNNDPSNPRVSELELALKRSKQGKSSKVKGATYERKLVKFLQTRFPLLKFGRTPSSGGYKKEVENESLRGDVVCLTEGVNFKLHMELKNRKAGWKAVQDWYHQACEDCIKGKVPCVIMHQAQGDYPSKDFVLVELKDFFDIIDEKKIILM